MVWFISSEAFVSYEHNLKHIISSYYEVLVKSKIDSLLIIASELCEDGKYIEALKCYDKVLHIEPNNTKAIIDKGVTLQNLELPSQAMQMYEKALNFEPENIDALINMGSALHTLGKYVDAISYYDIVLKLDEKNTLALAYKGLSLGESGNISLAIKYFRNALSIDCDYDLAQISLETAKKIMYSN